MFGDQSKKKGKKIPLVLPAATGLLGGDVLNKLR